MEKELKSNGTMMGKEDSFYDPDHSYTAKKKSKKNGEFPIRVGKEIAGCDNVTILKVTVEYPIIDRLSYTQYSTEIV